VSGEEVDLDVHDGSGLRTAQGRQVERRPDKGDDEAVGERANDRQAHPVNRHEPLFDDRPGEPLLAQAEAQQPSVSLGND